MVSAKVTERKALRVLGEVAQHYGWELGYCMTVGETYRPVLYGPMPPRRWWQFWVGQPLVVDPWISGGSWEIDKLELTVMDHRFNSAAHAVGREVQERLGIPVRVREA